MYDLAHLGFATDSTRLNTHDPTPVLQQNIPGVSSETHNLFHYASREDKLSELRNLELAEFRELNRLLGNLHASRENDETLLDRTQVLYCKNHDNRNLPILLAGGGRKHGQHLAFDTKNNHPLPKLFISMLQRIGIETDEFSTGKGTMNGLVLV